MEKPLGIKVIIAMSLLGGIIALIIMGVLIFYLGDMDNLFVTFIFLAPINGFLLAHFVAAYGLWAFKSWALKLSIWIYTLGALISMFFLVQPIVFGDSIEIGEIFESLLGVLITVAVVRYLSRKSIKEMYK